MMGLDQADVIEKELVTSRCAELTAFKKNPDFRGGAVLVVGLHLNDYRHLVRGVAFKKDLFQLQLFTAHARAFLDCALDDVAGNALLARFFDDRGETRITGWI